MQVPRSPYFIRETLISPTTSLDVTKTRGLSSETTHEGKQDGNLIIILVVICICSTCSLSADNSKALFCYYGSWSTSRPAPGNFSLDNFNKNLCTHLAFSFLLVREDGNIYADAEYGVLFEKMLKIREETGVKLLLAIGGASKELSTAFSKLASDTYSRITFIESAKTWLSKTEFDGIDIDWEFPASLLDGGRPEDRENLPILMKELNDALKTWGSSVNRTFIVSLACATGIEKVMNGYNISAIYPHVDYLNLMAYDLKFFVGVAEEKIGHHSALCSTKFDSDYQANLTITAIVDNFIGLLPLDETPRKLLLGVGAYGRSYSLKSREAHNFHDTAAGLGPKGPFAQTEGILSYSEICYVVPQETSSPWEFREDPEALAPYAFNDTLWVGYESEESAVRKTDYAMSRGLGGMMIWSIEQDDCNNICGGWYSCPIMTAVKNRLQYYDSHPTPPVDTVFCP